jgi:uncharacterized protein YecE (DUF72 family)
VAIVVGTRAGRIPASSSTGTRRESRRAIGSRSTPSASRRSNSTSSFYAIPAESTVEGWDRATPKGFRFDVKVHRLLSHHAAQPKDLPKDLRDDVETNKRGRVLSDRPVIDEMVHRTAEAMKPLADAGKLSAYLLQLTPRSIPGTTSWTSCFRDRGLAPVPVAVEFRRRSWASPKRFEAVLDWLSAHDAVFVCVDSPPGEHVPIFPRSTRSPTSGSRTCCHGRNTEGYLHGRSVAERFDYDYSKKEPRDRGPCRTAGGRCRERPRDVQQQREGARPKAARACGRSWAGPRPEPA